LAHDGVHLFRIGRVFEFGCIAWGHPDTDHDGRWREVNHSGRLGIGGFDLAHWC
jgi:hypothetical protein